LLYSEIGKLKVQLDWLKKNVWDQPAMMRQAWIDTKDVMAVAQQCALAGVSRATFYAQQRPGPIDESHEGTSDRILIPYRKSMWHLSWRIQAACPSYTQQAHQGSQKIWEF
jgi:hypothetical protein